MLGLLRIVSKLFRMRVREHAVTRHRCGLLWCRAAWDCSALLLVALSTCSLSPCSAVRSGCVALLVVRFRSLCSEFRCAVLSPGSVVRCAVLLGGLLCGFVALLVVRFPCAVSSAACVISKTVVLTYLRILSYRHQLRIPFSGVR